MWEVFNMGTGLCCVVDGGDAPAAAEILAERHPGHARDRRGHRQRRDVVRLPSVGLIGDRAGFRRG